MSPFSATEVLLVKQKYSGEVTAETDIFGNFVIPGAEYEGHI